MSSLNEILTFNYESAYDCFYYFSLIFILSIDTVPSTIPKTSFFV
ncbi:hypothetical protein BX611_1450 [Lutibacter oceani]|uniref:Uncharacterized protein n=1 Tax=Lutibacter oceani TaxID=1853311 RepID=A0A3D9RR03_9FLAO|nr:hypothetical protein BX611_1450 [Lutibacter oceani]